MSVSSCFVNDRTNFASTIDVLPSMSHFLARPGLLAAPSFTPILCNAQAAAQAAVAAATPASSGGGSGRKTLSATPGSPPLHRDANAAGNPYIRQSRAPSSASAAGIGDLIHEDSVAVGAAALRGGASSAASGNSGGGSGGGSAVSNGVSGAVGGGVCGVMDGLGLLSFSRLLCFEHCVFFVVVACLGEVLAGREMSVLFYTCREQFIQ